MNDDYEPDPRVDGFRDVELDLEGSRRAADRVRALFASVPAADVDRAVRSGATTRGEGGGEVGAGRALIERCGTDTRRRYATLLYVEEHIDDLRHRNPDLDDYGVLIAAACQVVETELDRRLIEPARAVAGHLIDVLRADRRKAGFADILDAWVGGAPATIGTGWAVLMGLRAGCKRGSEPVAGFLESRFHRRYAELVRDARFVTCVDDLRRTYRNPACHSTASFDQPAYERFVRTILARPGLREWDRWGPEPAEPDGGCGFLHHQLRWSKQAAPTAPDVAEDDPTTVVHIDVGEPAAADVFVGFAEPDRERVERVAAGLSAAGVSVGLYREPGDGADAAGRWASDVAPALDGCKALLLACSDASIRSWAVKRVLQGAAERGRPVLPVRVGPISYPRAFEFFLQGRACVDVTGGPPERWTAQLLRTLEKSGVRRRSAEGLPPSTAGEADAGPAADPLRFDWSLDGLRAVARFTDQIWPVPADAAGRGSTRDATRALGESQDGVEHGYRLGSRMRLKVWSEREAHLLLLDEGPGGTWYCLCPSHFAPDARLPRGESVLPQPRSRFESFVLTGRPGREQLLAILTDRPLGLDWMPGDPKVPARVLSGADIDALLAALRRAGPTGWTALSTYFDVLA